MGINGSNRRVHIRTKGGFSFQIQCCNKSPQKGWIKRTSEKGDTEYYHKEKDETRSKKPMMFHSDYEELIKTVEAHGKPFSATLFTPKAWKKEEKRQRLALAKESRRRLIERFARES